MNRFPFLLLSLAFAWNPPSQELKRDLPADATRAEAPSENSWDRVITDAGNVASSAPVNVRVAKHAVSGSVHDFSALTGKVSDACSACHVPHLQAVQPVERDGNQSLLDLFRVRSQREVFIPGMYMPGPSSLICLSCHNGTVASSTIGTSHALIADAWATKPSSRDFAFRDHPIGIPYPSGRADYRPIGSVLAGGRIALPDGRLECVSCHDPHNAAGEAKLLVMSNQRSALCLACHKK